MQESDRDLERKYKPIELLGWAILSTIIFAIYLQAISLIPDVENKHHDPTERFSSQTETSWFTLIFASVLPLALHVFLSMIFLSLKNGGSIFEGGKIFLAYLLNLFLIGICFSLLLSEINLVAFGFIISFLVAAYCTGFTVGSDYHQNVVIRVFLLHLVAVISAGSLGIVYDEYIFAAILTWNFLATFALAPFVLEQKFRLPINFAALSIFILSFVLATPSIIEEWTRSRKYQSKKEWKTAFDKKDQAQMKYLLENEKIKGDQIINQWTTAIYKDDVASVETMAKYAPEFDPKNFQENWMRLQSKEMAELLIAYGGFPTQAVDKNHLHYDVYLSALFQIKDTTILEVFVKYGADVNGVAIVPGFAPTTPIQKAREKKEQAKVEFLKNNGAVN